MHDITDTWDLHSGLSLGKPRHVVRGEMMRFTNLGTAITEISGTRGQYYYGRVALCLAYLCTFESELAVSSVTYTIPFQHGHDGFHLVCFFWVSVCSGDPFCL